MWHTAADVAWSVCLSVGHDVPCAVLKRLNRSRCCLWCGLRWPKKPCVGWGSGGSRSPQGKRQCWGNLPLPVVKYLFFSRPRFEGWLVHPRVGHTMDVLSPLISVLCHSDWLFHGQSCPSRPCVAFLACVHLALLLALSLSQGNSLVSAWCDHSMLASLLCRRSIVWARVSRSYVVFRS